jgi:uncharacterized protein YkwD
MVGFVGVRRLVLFVLLSGVLVVGCGRKDSNGSGGASGTEAAAIQLAQLINEERDLRGVNALSWDATIAAVETAHAQWLADKDPPGPYQWPYYEDEDGVNYFADRLDTAGYPARTAEQEWGVASETLTNAGLVFDQLPEWVFDAEWDYIGIGYVRPPYRESGKQYWVVGLVNK